LYDYTLFVGYTVNNNSFINFQPLEKFADQCHVQLLSSCSSAVTHVIIKTGLKNHLYHIF